MAAIDRKRGPGIVRDYALSFPDYARSELNNGIPVFEINAGTQEIIKVDIIFNVGRINEVKRAAAKGAFSLIQEGSTRHSSSELAHHFDFYGAVVKTYSGLEYSYVNMVCLTRHFDEVWEVFMSMVLEPLFDEDELLKYKSVTSQKLIDQISKNDVLSYRRITEIVFGENHPYGYNTEVPDIETLTREHLMQYWDCNVGFNHCFVTLSGKFSASLSDRIMRSIEGLDKQASPALPEFVPKVHTGLTERMATINEMQTSIKIGRRIFGRNHPDYTKVQVLNTVLGGYFGSRLMKNIREEKGYTYGIYSSLDVWKEDGFIYISADVANENVEPTIAEIDKEIEKLRREPIPEEEFEMVKNYMLGQMLHLIDGPFATAQLIKSIYTKDIEIEDFDRHVQALKKMNRNDIHEMAQKYLDKNLMTTVLAGKIK